VLSGSAAWAVGPDDRSHFGNDANRRRILGVR